MFVETMVARARPGHERALDAWLASESKRLYTLDGCISSFALSDGVSLVRSCVSFWIDRDSLEKGLREGDGAPPPELVEGPVDRRRSETLGDGPSASPRVIYTGIRVTDIERSLKFYSELLGFEPMTGIRSNPKLQSKNVLLRNPKTGHQIELNWYTEGGPFGVPFVVGEGLDHLGVHVADLPAFLERARSLGASLADLRPYRDHPMEAGGPFRVAYLYDPDGHMIEAYDIQGVPVDTPFSGGY